MRIFTHVFCVLAASLGIPAVAQETAVPPADPAVAAQATPLRISAGTEVVFEIMDPLGSQTSKVGDFFAIRLSEPVMIDGNVVVPAGAIGKGEVIHVGKAGFVGKAGELILAVRYIDHSGNRIPLRRFRFGKAGNNRANTAIVVYALVGIPGLFVRGGKIDVTPGTLGHALVATDTNLAAASSNSELIDQTKLQQGE